MIETLNSILNDVVGELGATIAITLFSILWPSIYVIARLAYTKLTQWILKQSPDYLDPLIDSIALMALDYADQIHGAGKIEKEARMQAALDAAERRLDALGMVLPRQVIEDAIEAMLARLEREGSNLLEDAFAVPLDLPNVSASGPGE